MANDPLHPLVLVVAMTPSGAIGLNGGLPWKIPEDLRHFKKVTVGHAVIMGRKTYASIGRPLPDRINIVLTRDRASPIPDCTMASTFQEAIELARMHDAEPRVIGGRELYAMALPIATRIYLTEVPHEVEADVYFPEFDRSEWRESDVQQGEQVIFRTLDRKIGLM